MTRSGLVPLLGLALLVGCRKKTPEAQEPGISLGGPQAKAEERPPVVGPVRWWDATGLCLEVPEAWSGLGRAADGTLLTLEQEDTGVRFEILLAEAPRDRRGLVPVLVDEGTYRDIPALGAAGIESWVSEVPGGPSLHVWNAAVRGQPVRFEARYPFGRAFVGMGDVEQLLRAVCLE